MAKLFRPYGKKESSEPEVSTPVTPEPTPGVQKKGAPTPRRRDAERARLQRVNPQLSPKEARRANAQANRERRMAEVEARDGIPEKVLMRDLVDSRFNLGEVLLPVLMLVLALTFIQPYWPQASSTAIVLMYGFLLIVLADLVLLWRRYKRLLAERMPGSTTKGKGVMLYGWNRAIQLRPLRLPKPRVQRGERI